MKTIFILLVAVLSSFSVFSQDYQKKLMEDVVKISGEKYTADDFNLLKLSDGVTTYQIKSYAEAPIGAISRDNFVSIFTYLTYEVINGLSEDKDATTSDLEEIIGNPDVEINCFMNKTGVQIEIKGANGTNRITQKWADIFKE